MNGGQPAQQEFFKVSLLEFKKQKMSGLTRIKSERENITVTNYQGPLPCNQVQKCCFVLE